MADIPHGDDSGRGLGGEGVSERAPLQVAPQGSQKAQEEVDDFCDTSQFCDVSQRCVHPYYAWTHGGKCMGCRKAPEK
jgi:hypothetical protein